MKKKILVFAGYYTPSIKGGGPIQSIKNLVDNLHEHVDFYIIAADRDLGDSNRFDEIQLNSWITVGHAKVYYTNLANLGYVKISKIIHQFQYDIIYINSFFSFNLTFKPLLILKFSKLNYKKIIVVPRGQFYSGALISKKIKKMFYIKIFKLLKLESIIIWHATNPSEENHIKEIFGIENTIIIAENLVEDFNEMQYDKQIEKCKEDLKILFLSRIHPKKNLKTAIQLLEGIKGNIQMNIYGPIEDLHYWNKCKKEISLLPSNISVSYEGIIHHKDIMSVYKTHHVFLFPTLGENFGHVIYEALLGGCPVITSDQTPWRELSQKRIGWDIALENKAMFKKAIQACVDLTGEEYKKLSYNCFNYAKLNGFNSNKSENYFKLFGDFI